MAKKWKALALALSMLLLMTGCGKASQGQSAPGEEKPSLSESALPEAEAARSESELIEDMVVFYGSYGQEAEPKNAELLNQLRAMNPALADKWEKILALWKSVNQGLEIYPDVLPDGLPDSDELCLVVLGFQLNPDGSMRDELIQRLQVALASAEKYPNALIVCTGGGTAADNKEATEAGKMAEYLIEQGVAPERVIVEDRSQTTAQNAIYSCEILAQQYPQVRQLAIVSSDYHIATGVLLFGAQAILTAEEPGNERFTVVSNAAYPAPSGNLSTMFQAGALIELAGDVKTAYDIYFETYDIHELPPLEDTP